MKDLNNIIIIILSAILAGVLLYWTFFITMWKITMRDVKNVEITGTLYGTDKKPMKGQILNIVNSLYDGGENIGEYTREENYSTITDEHGKFFLKLKESAFISIESLDTNNDTITLKSIEIHKKKINVDLSIDSYKRIGKRYKNNIFK
ncbi:MAG: hypothetical protein AAF620_16675 [Bacteroidota bacterium]